VRTSLLLLLLRGDVRPIAVPVNRRDGVVPMTAWQRHTTDALQTRAVGAELAALLRAGDVVVLSGEVGAGKTTFTQGLGEGLGVRGPITSPTFVLARKHPSLVGGPDLVHVDAYRIGGTLDLEDLDLDADLPLAVTVVEWGHGLADDLAADRVEVRVLRPVGDEVGDAREISISFIGDSWNGRRP
jgi:tRNA threonylcarbamoyladenosine biosynthesis protein TsaE